MTIESHYPGDDYAIVRYSESRPPRTGDVWVGAGRPNKNVTSSAPDPLVGFTVSRSGATTGVSNGVIQAINHAVQYKDENIVSGMVRTTACAEPGDSGGPFCLGSWAVGLLSGGSDDCTSGGLTFFQPLKEVLAGYGVTVY
ncbi:MAG TPA: S1 family peptidase [Solirubrobacteraceae bacterium]|nr:S1 family peptidase [Solirubrobacteraceae bacterium]